MPILNVIDWPSAVRTVNAVTLLSPSESMSVRTPSTGEVSSAPGVPLAGTLSELVAMEPGVVEGEALQAAIDRRRGHDEGRRPEAQDHAGPTPVPLLPGFTAGSPAAHRGHVASPGSYVGSSSCHSARNG